MARVVRAIAIVAIVLGVFLVVAQAFSPTGAVIDISALYAKVSFIIGIFLVIFGIVLFLLSELIWKTNGEASS